MHMQLALRLQLRDDATFASFYPARNAEVLQQLKRFLTNKESLLYLHGISGSGKTHLLQAACHAMSCQRLTATYIPLNSYPELELNYLSGLEQINLICLDDIEAIAGMNNWEEGLFHLFNRITSSGAKLLVASNYSPIHLPLTLPDLRSRLSGGVALGMHKVSDSEKEAVLLLRAQCRGLKVSASVIKFIINHFPRDLSSLFGILEQLDKASLYQKRKITIPFVKAVLAPA